MPSLRIPYRVQVQLEAAQNRWAYFKNRRAHRATAATSGALPSVLVNCGFQGKSGGTYAVANIANLLAAATDVRFLSTPTSVYNRLLSDRVRIVPEADFDADVYLCDASCSHEFMRAVTARGKRVIVTCHGLPNALQQLGSERLAESLALADLVHFVAPVQQEAFAMDGSRCQVIPNTSARVVKTTRTHNVGIVGNLREARKNAAVALEIALRSTAERIHLWGAGEPVDHPKVTAHGWENDKTAIYNSFDVLVFLSQLECCPMVVIESLSAGIPCLLSSIPAHQQFRTAPGVELVDSDDHATAVTLLDRLLAAKESLRQPAMRHWDQHYAEPVILERWKALLARVTA